MGFLMRVVYIVVFVGLVVVLLYRAYPCRWGGVGWGGVGHALQNNVTWV